MGVIELEDKNLLAAFLRRHVRSHAYELGDLDEFDWPYPGTWFVPRMLATNRYVGIRENGRLVCVAGVYVHSPTWGVAALGNVATLPEL